jgi:hypothetical protein
LRRIDPRIHDILLGIWNAWMAEKTPDVGVGKCRAGLHIEASKTWLDLIYSKIADPRRWPEILTRVADCLSAA